MKKGFIDWLNITKPDILCLQETKAMKEQVDVALIEKQGYHHYWFSAKKGTAVLRYFQKKSCKYILRKWNSHMDLGKNNQIRFRKIIYNEPLSSIRNKHKSPTIQI